ncbi:hypothetical protein DMB72_02515 [Staphylococcus saccharolyticus]|nr:hypothetical protein DMB72_02515 [Staphylococcus saccharolyticus]TAB00547.1 hypothetical protein DMB73_01730 [Staphylococcus saccharolyticus]TAB02795.1 hypothetical protein DMB78_02515 [Staphylococcus saccharolyticus]
MKIHLYQAFFNYGKTPTKRISYRNSTDKASWGYTCTGQRILSYYPNSNGFFQFKAYAYLII